ncbi:MAG: BlaI/MecI/CopY family transcriptional regulator [Thermoguttaceae bacterium]
MTENMPTERELEVLKILWKKKKMTVRELWKIMSKKQPDLGYTAVLTLMQYMEKKNMVAHEVVGKAYHYYAYKQEQETISSMVKRFVNSVFDGAVDAYVAHALDNETMTTDELDILEDKIRQAKAKKSSQKRRKK